MKILIISFLGILLIPLIAMSQKNKDSSTIYIKVETNATDTLMLEYTDNCFYPDIRIPTHQLYFKQASPFLTFKLDSGLPFSYFSIIRRSKNSDEHVLRNFLVKPGDSIVINLSNSLVTFSGRGAEKNKAIQAIEFAAVSRNKIYIDSLQSSPPYRSKKSFAKFDSTYVSYESLELKKRIIEAQNACFSKLKALDKYKNSMPAFDFQLMKINVIAEKEHLILKMYNTSFLHMPLDISEKYKNFIHQQINEVYTAYTPSNFNEIDSNIIQYSQPFLEYTILLAEKTALGKSGRYDIIKSKFSGEPLDRLLALLFSLGFKKDSTLADKLPDAIETVKTSYLKTILLDLNSKLTKGMQAFDFALQDTSGKIVRLSDFKGKIVVLDMWFTGCTACKIMSERLKKIYDRIHDDTAFSFLSVSVDLDKRKWINSVKGGDYTNKHTIDLYTNGLGTGHPMIKHYNVFAYPTLIVIDRTGKIYSGNPSRPLDIKSDEQFTSLLLDAKK